MDPAQDVREVGLWVETVQLCRLSMAGQKSPECGVRPWNWTIVSLNFPSRAFKEKGHMTKRRHRRHSIPVKRMIVEAYFNGTALNALSVEYDLCRHLIRTWIEKYENGEFDTETQQSEQIPEYEARIAALERLVGRQALEIEFLKTARRRTPAKNKENSSIVTGPPASQSDEDVN
jgi:transposase-like protein